MTSYIPRFASGGITGDWGVAVGNPDDYTDERPGGGGYADWVARQPFEQAVYAAQQAAAAKAAEQQASADIEAAKQMEIARASAQAEAVRQAAYWASMEKEASRAGVAVGNPDDYTDERPGGGGYADWVARQPFEQAVYAAQQAAAAKAAEQPPVAQPPVAPPFVTPTVAQPPVAPPFVAPTVAQPPVAPPFVAPTVAQPPILSQITGGITALPVNRTLADLYAEYNKSPYATGALPTYQNMVGTNAGGGFYGETPFGTAGKVVPVSRQQFDMDYYKAEHPEYQTYKDAKGKTPYFRKADVGKSISKIDDPYAYYRDIGAQLGHLPFAGYEFAPSFSPIRSPAYAGMGDSGGMLELAYRNILGRQPTPAERQYQESRLGQGLTGQGLAASLSTLPEFQRRHEYEKAYTEAFRPGYIEFGENRQYYPTIYQGRYMNYALDPTGYSPSYGAGFGGRSLGTFGSLPGAAPTGGAAPVSGILSDGIALGSLPDAAPGYWGTYAPTDTGYQGAYGGTLGDYGTYQGEYSESGLGATGSYSGNAKAAGGPVNDYDDDGILAFGRA